MSATESLIERLKGRARQLDNAGDGLGYYSRGDALLDREAAAELEALRSRCERMEKALAPFANEAAGWDEMWEDAFVPVIDTAHSCEACGHVNSDTPAKFTVGDLRRARALQQGDAAVDGGGR